MPQQIDATMLERLKQPALLGIPPWDISNGCPEGCPNSIARDVHRIENVVSFRPRSNLTQSVKWPIRHSIR
jgi:hypothetical protein